MIKTFKCKETGKIYNGIYSKMFSANVQKRALDKLFNINAALDIKDLINPPSNRLHSLEGDRKGQYSISINMQWRICFTWENNNAFNVEIIDYH